MKTNTIILAFLGLIILVAVLTNPNEARHKEVVKNKIFTYFQKQLENDKSGAKNEKEDLLNAAAILLGGEFIDIIFDKVLSSDNYVLFSTTKVTWEGQTRIIGVGAFGNIFVTNKFEESLTQAMLDNQK